MGSRGGHFGPRREVNVGYSVSQSQHAVPTCREGFYDTFWSFLLGLYSVRHGMGTGPCCLHTYLDPK